MNSVHAVEQARRDGTVLGIPLGELGLFQTLLMSAAAGFAAFFAVTFVSIVVLLGVEMAQHHAPNYAVTYKYFGAPDRASVCARNTSMPFLNVMGRYHASWGGVEAIT